MARNLLPQNPVLAAALSLTALLLGAPRRAWAQG